MTDCLFSFLVFCFVCSSLGRENGICRPDALAKAYEDEVCVEVLHELSRKYDLHAKSYDGADDRAMVMVVGGGVRKWWGW